MAKISGAAQGSAYAAENVAGQDILPQAGAVITQAAPAWTQYLTELEGLLSPDPKMRMEAAAPVISDATALSEGRKKQISVLPRGGEKAYLSSEIDKDTASKIGDALSQEFSQALAAIGKAGEYGISTALNAETAAGGIFTGASGALSGTAGAAGAEGAALAGVLGDVGKLIANFF